MPTANCMTWLRCYRHTAGILLMAAIAFYGFYTSLGGRPIFGAAVLEE
jgi:hypothetical protein